MIHRIDFGTEAWLWLDNVFQKPIGEILTVGFELRGNDRIAFQSNGRMWTPSLYIRTDPKQ